MSNDRSRRIRLWILTIPAAGAVALTALLVRGPLVLPATDPNWAQTVTATPYLTAQYGLIVAFVLPIAGLWALFAYTSGDRRTAGPAFWGMLMSLWGTALALPTTGIMAYAVPAFARSTAQGAVGAGQAIMEAVEASLILGGVAGILYTAGPILLGIAIWRTATLPKWAAIAFAVHGLLLSFGFAVFAAVLAGWALFTLAGAAIAWNLHKEWRSTHQLGA